MITTSILWLITGAALLAIEAFGAPGIGLMFAGLGAILVGLLIELGLLAESDSLMQWAVFLVTTSVFAVLLWKRLKRWRSGPAYSNMIGTDAIVAGQLSTERMGNVRWSGTLMQAKLVPGGGATVLADGEVVIITAVEGNVLHVRAK